MEDNSQEGSRKLKYCCPIKEYFSKDANLVDTLEILPRVIKCKKHLKLNEEYEQEITVKNIGLYARLITYSTDSPQDTQLLSRNFGRHGYLAPSATMSFRVCVKPLNKRSLQENRCVFLDCKHPSLRIEIPIMAYQSNDMNYVPTSITMPQSVPKSFSYYEFVVYNSSFHSTSVTIRTLSNCLTAQAESAKISPRDYVRVVLKLNVQNMDTSKGLVKIRFRSVNYIVDYIHEPIDTSIYISTGSIKFEGTKFSREATNKFTICNETFTPIPFDLNLDLQSRFIPKPEDTTNAERNSKGEEAEQRLTANNKPNITDQVIKQTYSITPTTGILAPRACTEFTTSFKPKFDNYEFDDMEPPFEMNTQIIVTTKGAAPLNFNVAVEGLIDGPEMYISPKSFDFRKVYLGEEHCEMIRITNIDGMIKSKVRFYGCTSTDCEVFVKPHELELETCSTGLFKFTFYSLVVGKILFKIQFKVQNGAYLNVLVKAVSVPVRVKTFPDIIEFGCVPFGVPQKRTVLLMNPLAVPIYLQCFADDNGSEVPLVLNVDDVNSLPPVNVKNPLEYVVASHKGDSLSVYNDIDLGEEKKYGSETELSIFSGDRFSVCSDTFQRDVIDNLPKLANEVIRQVKLKRVMEKADPETRIIKQVTDELLKLDYFEEFTRYNNYARMDWDAIPSDPIEVYFDTEIILLSPNASRTVTFLIVPNNVGYFNRAVNIRCCPHRARPCDDNETDNLENRGMIVDTKRMITKLWFEYNCRLPELKWESDIHLIDKPIYAMERTSVDIAFRNISDIGGFLHFVVVPSCPKGVLTFRDSLWKFYIPPFENVVAKCEVRFRRLGKVTLSGLVKVVGAVMGIPFHITANVLSPRLLISPKLVRRAQRVLEKTVTYVYITNLTPTSTEMAFYLRSDRHQSVYPSGARLAPTGQGTYVEITSMYSDPEVYKNILYVDLLFDYKIEIPLMFTVFGVPIVFDPDITKDFNIGAVLLSTAENFECRKVNYTKDIKVSNLGEQPYQILFHKLKSIKICKGECFGEAPKSQFILEPKAIYLAPGEETSILLTAFSCEEAFIRTAFRAVVINQINPMLVRSSGFNISAKFTPALLKWSRQLIRITYNRTHKFKQHPQMEFVELMNATGVSVEDIFIKVTGPFKIKLFYEHPFTKEVKLSGMAKDEKQEVTVLLDEKRIREETSAFLNGKIHCCVMGKMQAYLPLRVDIHYPDIIIVDSNIVIFTSNEEKDTRVALENVGGLDAEYKWNKLGECIRYIEKDNDYTTVASDLLYEILRMIELHIKEDDLSLTDPLCEQNFSKCYQKYRCVMAELNDPYDIGSLIYEIIDNLDYEHKRYMVKLSDDIDTEKSKVKAPYSQKVVQSTFEEILQKLKLEDSYEVSEPSQEECSKEEHVYFYEKTGMVLGKHGAYSLLHLPAVRKGNAHIAGFLLDVMGGQQHKLLVTVANLEKVVNLIPESAYLGVRPWYEPFYVKIAVQNVTEFKVNVHVNDMPKKKLLHGRHSHLINGYSCILNSRIFLIKPYGQHNIKIEGLMGFGNEFIRDFSILINNHTMLNFRLRGQGIMPILLATANDIPRTEQSELETIKEYRLLQKIYYFNIFKDITYIDEEDDQSLMTVNEHDPDIEKDVSFSQISILSESRCSVMSSTCTRRVKANWEHLLRSYVLVYKNESLPHSSVLEQLLNMEKFIHDLNDNNYKMNILQRLYREYVQFQLKYDPKQPMNLKFFTVQPLPFEQWGYVIEMPDLKINRFRAYYLDLQFFGPGKLIASARTAVKIPGLNVYFTVRANSLCQQFIYYKSDNNMPNFFMKRYRNMWERLIDEDCDPKLLHAHSFDCEGRCKFHKRDVANKTLRDVRDINNYYNSLNKSVYEENRHHFINCMIFSKSQGNFTGTKFRVNIILKTDSEYYTEGQVFEDYLYIDLHMGPTLPILMRGLVRA